MCDIVQMYFFSFVALKVVGDGEPELDCNRCIMLEETGAMHAVREVCAYRGKRKGVLLIGQT